MMQQRERLAIGEKKEKGGEKKKGKKKSTPWWGSCQAGARWILQVSVTLQGQLSPAAGTS